MVHMSQRDGTQHPAAATGLNKTARLVPDKIYPPHETKCIPACGAPWGGPARSPILSTKPGQRTWPGVYGERYGWHETCDECSANPSGNRKRNSRTHCRRGAFETVERNCRGD